ncbi:twin-arginine translocation protein TatA [Halogeometricum borinquense DSM 11551]|uniref:Sec-independent protein translocase protein TatA n=1 Tax=Halogeometricum borinquense (strain ATCC 700274 / DSM 11551 / JCM 10706 / KCTC 4070 / PR3) TaxID=469382 RepID=E4NPA4_HALBP|nr:twin-arginine translocase TatA/TatE family subunit [Halogeometricum borinquense]ADQ67645.1 twin arginine-targeting protein translocase, TatA/E family [Halogeometricum borinquense DSM 11551]ELY23674.1 twin-arginine translocation protein TatA [Halogeometricum borinquense DSM 11551]
MFQITPLFPGIPGGPELLIVLLVLVLLFGANKIPKLARSTGQAMGEFQRGRNEIEEELKQMENDDDEDEDEETTTTTSTSTSTSSDSN